MSAQDERTVEAPNWSRLDLSGSAIEILQARVQALEAERDELREKGPDLHFAAGFLLKLKEEAEAQYARAEAADARVQALEAEMATARKFDTLRRKSELEAENARLKAALERLAEFYCGSGDTTCHMTAAQKIARAALTDPRREEYIERVRESTKRIADRVGSADVGPYAEPRREEELRLTPSTSRPRRWRGRSRNVSITTGRMIAPCPMWSR